MIALVNQVAHYPVLYREVLENLPKNPKFILDGTLGHAGHARLILDNNPSIINYFGLDKDPNIISFFRQNPINKLIIKQADFQKIEEFNDLNQQKYSAILVDLGTSQSQLQTDSRGFSLLKEGPLDMRMNPNSGITLKEFLLNTNEIELAKIIKDYSEERFARRIANAILKNMDQITNTVELAKVIADAIPWANKRDLKIHPATRTFQALRIYINDELSNLDKALDNFLDLLNSGGHLLVISFHSLEDRIVKNKFRAWQKEEYQQSFFSLPEITKKSLGVAKPYAAIKPTDLEISENKASRSARLRVFIKG